MIQVQRSRSFDVYDIIQRSPVAAVKGAEDTLNTCLFRSAEVRVGLINGQVACIWGMIPPTVLSEAAYLWLLTTDIIAEHKFLFVRHSQRYVEEALKIYPTLVGDVIAGNMSAVRWLRWLGAVFEEPKGKRIPFTIRAKHG